MSRRIPQPSAAALALMGLLVIFVFPASAQNVTTLPPGQVGKAYSATLGVGTWKLAQGDLPPGLRVVETGKVEGTPTAGKSDPYLFNITVSFSSQQSSTLPFSITIAPATAKVQATDDNKEWEARAIVGYHQAGASSAKYTQNFFFDFFIMRALSSNHLWEKGTWNLWGDVRIASAPQQITTGVGTFATNFATQVSNLPVNQLAQSADFQTGLEGVLQSWDTKSGGHRTAGIVGYLGAMGAFQPPDSQMQIFNVPGKTSLQYPAFAAAFPSAANATYVGFVPPNRERFYRNYGLGMRVATFDKNSPLAAPATYTLSFGEDEAITGGIFRSVVGKIDVFYPLPLSGMSGKYKCVYLFGTANLRLSKATQVPTFALQNPNANGTVVQPFDPNLAIVTVRSTRDTYRFGGGVDLINLIQSMTGQDKVQKQ